MNYILKHFNTPLICFSAQSGAEPDIQILAVNGEAKALLPLDLAEVTSSGMKS